MEDFLKRIVYGVMFVVFLLQSAASGLLLSEYTLILLLSLSTFYSGVVDWEDTKKEMIVAFALRLIFFLFFFGNWGWLFIALFALTIKKGTYVSVSNVLIPYFVLSFFYQEGVIFNWTGFFFFSLVLVSLNVARLWFYEPKIKLTETEREYFFGSEDDEEEYEEEEIEKEVIQPTKPDPRKGNW